MKWRYCRESFILARNSSHCLMILPSAAAGALPDAAAALPAASAFLPAASADGAGFFGGAPAVPPPMFAAGCPPVRDPSAGDPPAGIDAQSVHGRWGELPTLQADWEKKMAARRDEALRAFGDEDARYDHLDRIVEGVAVRRDALLELELALGLPSPGDLTKERLAQCALMRG